MKKSLLIDEINAFATARASGHPLLIQRQGEVLEAVMSKLPDELPEIEVSTTDPPA